MSTKPSIEQLLKPRYRVIADYPGNSRAIGEIYCHVAGDVFGVKDIPLFMYQHDLEKYPHLFKKLKWWEERKVSEFPGYVKVDGRVDKADWSEPNWIRIVGYGHWMIKEPVMCFFEPDTEANYLTYMNKNKEI
jgi:hypothetical protein